MANKVRITHALIEATIDGGHAEGTIQIGLEEHAFQAEFSGSDRGTNWTIGNESYPVYYGEWGNRRFDSDTIELADEELDRIWQDAAAMAEFVEDGTFVGSVRGGEVVGAHLASDPE